MKKFFTLLMVAFLATAAFAQNAKPVRSTSSRINDPILMKEKSAKESAAGWFSYANFLYNAYLPQGGIESGNSSFLCIDTNGLVHYVESQQDTVGYYDHPNFFAAAQTFDFMSEFFDEVSDEGDLSFNQTSSFNIDSIDIRALYFREANVPAGTKDTLIIGIYTTSSPDAYEYTGYDNTCFYYFPYNFATGTQQGTGVHIYKFPIGDEHVSTEFVDPDDGQTYITYANFDFPINLTNITDKVWNICYTFKRGYEFGLNDTIVNYSYVRFTTWMNPNSNYSAWNNTHTAIANDPFRCSNLSHGGYIYNFLDGPVDYFYPGFMFSGSIDYPKMFVKVSCTDCAIVGVEDMEKENITVYPNPATNVVNVKLAGDKEAKVQMFNLVGQQVYNGTATNTASINVSNMKAGVYMLKVSQNGKVYTSKVVVK